MFRPSRAETQFNALIPEEIEDVWMNAERNMSHAFHQARTKKIPAYDLDPLDLEIHLGRTVKLIISKLKDSTSSGSFSTNAVRFFFTGEREECVYWEGTAGTATPTKLNPGANYTKQINLEHKYQPCLVTPGSLEQGFYCTFQTPEMILTLDFMEVAGDRETEEMQKPKSDPPKQGPQKPLKRWGPQRP